VRSVIESNFTFHDYHLRVLDAKIKSDKYLSVSASAIGQTKLRTAIRLTTRLYELASVVWDGDLSVFMNPDPDLVTKCPVVGKLLADPESLRLAAAMQGLGMRDEARDTLAKIAGQPVLEALWKCASIQMFEVESLQAQVEAPERMPSSPALTGEVYRVGVGVTSPVVIYKIDPGYTADSRKPSYPGPWCSTSKWTRAAMRKTSWS
jgi:hypothetical protein